ncbi:MAG: T9SS type A sorting domain-containing protein [Bacteroidales bacterium]|nr:T9SS type A sorting domain-containing protein [Bacteroidales bacterium]
MIFSALIRIIHIKTFIRLTITLLCFLSWVGAASAESKSKTDSESTSESASDDVKHDGLQPFETYGRIELEEDIRIVDYPILSVSEGEMARFGLSVAYSEKQVEILGITTPVAKARLTYGFSDGTLHFNWKRPSPLAVSKGDTLAILRIYLKHSPTSHLDRYFRISTEGQEAVPVDTQNEEDWHIALPEVDVYYYETFEDAEEVAEETAGQRLASSHYNHETRLRQQGGRASTVEIVSVIPNPMKSWADITYSVQQDCIVSLKLYTLLGEEVATLVNDRRSAGLYRHNITPPGFAAGMYVLRLSTTHDNVTESDIMKVVVHN